MNDKNTKLVMVLERSSFNLDANRDGEDVTLEGIFAQFGVVNNNDRLYEESEYLPHLEYLNKKIKENRLLGELDHPEKFDISLSKTSHIIESLEYDKGTRQLRGRVKLLDTPSGKIAKDLVRAGVPISISSRAAGLVESNKKVKIKKIFTYDLVADPGFENAVLSKINESLGFNNDFVSIYDMSEEYPELLEDSSKSSEETPETPKTKTTDLMEFVTTEEMNAYSLVVKTEFEKLQEKLQTMLNEKESSANTELLEKVNSMNESVVKMQQYLDYLSSTTNKSIEYTEYIAERLDKVIDYTDYVAKTLDESIEYSEKVSEKTEQSIKYSEYLKEQFEKGVAYSEYLKECLEKTVDYAEHIAEKADKGIQYSEYIGEKAEQSIEYSEYIGEKLKQTISYTEYLAEGLNKGIAYSEYLAEQTQAVADYTEFAINEKTTTSTMETPIVESKQEKQNIDYKTLPSKVDLLIESINKQKKEEINEKHFGVMMLLDEARRVEFKTMNETTKQKVLAALNDNAVKTEEDATRIWESVLHPNIEKWIEEAPLEYKHLWESLDNKSKETLIAQSKTYKLETPYQIKNFWETRPASILKKSSTIPLNESKTEEQIKVTPLGYSPEYIKQMESLLGKYNRK